MTYMVEREPDRLSLSTAGQPTAISTHLNELLISGGLKNIVKQSDYINRTRALPLLAERKALSTNTGGFASPTDLTTLDLRGLGLVPHGFSLRDRKALSETISPIYHMVLIAYEATPRPVGFAMNGYSASDFLAYIYQDVAACFIHTPEVQSEVFTREKANQIKMWLSEKVPRKQNSPQRHIRRRLMIMLNRTNQQINSLFIDREISTEMMVLFRKLMERDDNIGYMEGQLRNYRAVRSDFNSLAETLTLPHYVRENDFDAADAFRRIDCPATISDFASTNIDKPRSPNRKKRTRTRKK